MAMFTLWLMPMSSVRMTRETAVGALRVGGVVVCADTNVTELVNSNQLKQVAFRIWRIGNGSRERTVSIV